MANSPDSTPTQSSPVLKHILEALYVVNKHAKKFASLARENYELDKHNRATINSYKREALYELKEHVLRDLLDQARKIEEHEINGRNYYCLYFGDYSFHVPSNAILLPPDRATPGRSLDNFTTDDTKTESQRPLEDALTTLKTEFGHNANNFLPERYIPYGETPYFIGWPAIRESVTTPTEHL
jgi:hypothetical protein